MYKLAVVGCGFVGNSVRAGFEYLFRDKVDFREYDKYKDTEDLESVVNNSGILFIALPTPMKQDGSCDLSIIEIVIDDIDHFAEKSKAIIVKSTIPPGSTQKFQDEYRRHTFVFSPEFLTEKRSFEDFLEQDRIILGFTSNKQLFPRVDKLFQDFAAVQKNPALIVRVPSEQAELLKYATNCFLATKLSFFNEIYQICQAAKLDYTSLVETMKLDVRIGRSHMRVPGDDKQLGWSKSCFPKDINALIAFAKDIGVDPLMLESAWTKNLVVREKHDWEDLKQVSGRYEKK